MGFSPITAALLKEPQPAAAWCSGNGIPGCWGMGLRPGQVWGMKWVCLCRKHHSLPSFLLAAAGCCWEEICSWKSRSLILLHPYAANPTYKASCKQGLCYSCKCIPPAAKRHMGRGAGIWVCSKLQERDGMSDQGSKPLQLGV